jgi:hypothetical protein
MENQWLMGETNLLATNRWWLTASLLTADG